MVRSKETRHFNSHHNDKRRAILKRRSIIKGTNNRSRKCRQLKQVPCILNFELPERGDWLPRFIPLGETSVVFLRVVSFFFHSQSKACNFVFIKILYVPPGWNLFGVGFFVSVIFPRPIKILHSACLSKSCLRANVPPGWIVRCFFLCWFLKMVALWGSVTFVLGKYFRDAELLVACRVSPNKSAWYICCVLHCVRKKKMKNSCGNFVQTCAEYNNVTSAATVYAPMWFLLWANTLVCQRQILASMTSLCKKKRASAF